LWFSRGSNRPIEGLNTTCPTRADLQAFRELGGRAPIHLVWDDPVCRFGCRLENCTVLSEPCCVTSSDIGWLRAFDLVCCRMIENKLWDRVYLLRESPKQFFPYCIDYVTLPVHEPKCALKDSVVIPKILHSIGYSPIVSSYLRTAAIDASFVNHHVDDANGYNFIRKHCSSDAAKAYKCLNPAAFRADLFRFCALYAQGGVYLDEDIVLLKPLNQTVSMCSAFSLGYDQSTGTYLSVATIGMQMKILASVPGHPISLCMITNIVEHVRSRFDGVKRPLAITGPELLRKCFLLHEHYDVKVTYLDTRGADWPYSGLRRGADIIAYEKSSRNRHFSEIMVSDGAQEYAEAVKKRQVYSPACEL